MRKITKEEKETFEKAMRTTEGHKLHRLRIVLWGFFTPWKQYVFVDSLNAGMHWWAAYNTAKNAKRDKPKK